MFHLNNICTRVYRVPSNPLFSFKETKGQSTVETTHCPLKHIVFASPLKFHFSPKNHALLHSPTCMYGIRKRAFVTLHKRRRHDIYILTKAAIAVWVTNKKKNLSSLVFLYIYSRYSSLVREGSRGKIQTKNKRAFLVLYSLRYNGIWAPSRVTRALTTKKTLAQELISCDAPSRAYQRLKLSEHGRTKKRKRTSRRQVLSSYAGSSLNFGCPGYDEKPPVSLRDIKTGSAREKEVRNLVTNLF